MLIKTLLSAAAIAVTATVATATAEAKTKFDIYVDVGSHDYGDYDRYQRPQRHNYVDIEDDYEPRRPRHPRPRHVEYNDDYGISCGQGANRVRNAGYRKVYAFDCDGRTYGYTGRRHGERWNIIVNSNSGRVISARPAY